MQVVRQIQKVLDRTLVVHLPMDFQAEHVEVIILPVQLQREERSAAPSSGRQNNHEVSAAIDDFMAAAPIYLTDDERAAYDRVCTVLRHGRRADEPRILGLFAGLLQISDDFDAPLADEDLYAGIYTDQYGLGSE
jgi:hypothetical protein